MLGGEGRIGGLHADMMDYLPVAEVIFHDTARCKILRDASTTPRLTSMRTMERTEQYISLRNLVHELLWPLPNHRQTERT